MADDHEIWQSAQEMVNRYGDNALREIKKRIRELDQAGETEARAIWKMILEAAKALLDTGKRH
jgi:hypothetical protein